MTFGTTNGNGNGTGNGHARGRIEDYEPIWPMVPVNRRRRGNSSTGASRATT